jgi:nitric oxide reductase subunit C
MPGTRAFFIACSALAVALVVVLFGGALGTHAMPPEASAGAALWRARGCEGCHTLFGEGGAYAPDLTHIYSQRGVQYLRDFLVDPGSYHPDQRVMPRFGLTRDETEQLLAFLEWVDQQKTGFPPRLIQVSSGGTLASSVVAASAASNLPNDPVERGRYWFSHTPAICSTCHSVEPGVIVVGPSLAGIATRAATRVPGQSAEQYIRNSILHPSDYVVDGFRDAMQKNFADVLSSDQINGLIAFLMTLK